MSLKGLFSIGAKELMANQLYTGNTSKPVTGTSEGINQNSLDVANKGTPASRSAFGDNLSESIEPVVQVSAQYGILSTVETFTATGGTATTSNNMFTCTTGTNVGGYGVIRTKKPTIYREGQGLMARFTAVFDSANAVANSLQFAGLFNVQDTVAFGYRGTDFGILFDTYGAQEIRELDITGSGNGNLELTLNSVLYTIPITTGTAAHNAYEIEAWMTANQSVWDAEQVDDKVLFRNKNAATASGTYSIGGASGLTGNITQITAGAAKTESTILEADWNGDKVTFDKSKGNVFMIKVSYLGFGPISFFILDPDSGLFKRVHTIKYQNNYTQPSISNRALKVGWTAASLGSTTNITVQGASAGTFIEGRSRLNGESHASINSNTSVSTSFEAVLTIKALESFGGKAMLGRISFSGIEVSTDSTKEVIFKIVKNATLGETNFTYHEEGDSIALVDIVDHADSSSHPIYAGQVGAGGSVARSLKEFGIDLLANETMTVYAKVVSGSASDVTVTLIWKEDI
jgi:hypothetical protein